MIGLVVAWALAGAGCAVTFAKRSPWDVQQLAELSDQLEQFKTLARLKAEEADELRRAKDLLERRLAGADVSIGYDQRGVVARMLDQVLFDSGKAQLRQSAHPVLDRVAQVLQEVAGQPVGIEGHTDNEPIKHSGWADNNALSQARAQAVATYLIDRHGIPASRLTVIGYGESRPIMPNDTTAGRAKNRRVEIIILPQSSGASYQAEAGRVSATYVK
jgi:chemotaxis protein MotB